jgi:hypothetical protein
MMATKAVTPIPAPAEADEHQLQLAITGQDWISRMGLKGIKVHRPHAGPRPHPLEQVDPPTLWERVTKRLGRDRS